MAEVKDYDFQTNLTALKEIRNNALMLSLGNAYLCEEPFLKKIGHAIYLNLEKLKGDISALKKKFPGKFVAEIDTDKILREIHDTADSLQEPDQAIDEKCTVGELGQELEASINALANAINSIRGQVEGEALAYSKRDSALKVVGGMKDIGRSVGDAFTFLLKILLCLIVIAILPLSYLYLTMDKEESILKEITESEASIQSQQGALSKLEDEKKQLARQIETMREREKDLSRQEKIEMMDLDMKIHKLNDESDKIRVEIDTYKKKVMEGKKKIEEIKRKSFIKRLFRQ